MALIKNNDQTSEVVNSTNVWGSDYFKKALFSGIFIFKRALGEPCQIQEGSAEHVKTFFTKLFSAHERYQMESLGDSSLLFICKTATE